MGALDRWDGFLAQIEGRHRGVRVEAEAAGRAFIASVAAGGDYQPLSNQLMAVRSRLQELETMIIDTWHAKVEDTIFAEGLGVPERDAAYQKGNALKRALDNEREELEPRLFAELSRARFAAAIATYPRGVPCSKCGTALAAPFSFRGLELACTCGGRTQFDPGELMRSVAAVGTHAIAQEAAVLPWREMRASDNRLHDNRPPHPLALLKDYERSQIAYWRVYIAARAQFEPELARDQAMEIRSRMEQWYTYTADFEENWVKAGKPREPI